VAFAAAADDDFAVLEIFKVLLIFFLEEVAAFVAIGDAFAVEVVLTVVLTVVLWVEVVFVEVVALLTTSTPSTLLAWPAMMG